jgi:glucose/arabinose dehydrogenase
MTLIKPFLLAAGAALALSAQAQAPFQLVPFASGFSEPVAIENAGDERLFVVEKRGAIQILDARGNRLSTPFLDIDPQVSSGSERGLLGLAFHPNYSSNGYFYVNYTNNSGNTVVSRFTRSALNPNQADPASEQIVLIVTQPFSNHNAGDLDFGPDGYLYIPLGDGGSAGDPGNRSQTRTNLLGKVLRIDVDGGSPYAIPPDNPFVGDPSYAPEIWALGLRNPWRCSFDPQTGDFWIADVGQDLWEEINVQPASSPGGENYGWRCYEGNVAYNTSGCSAASAYDFPVFVYPHNFSTGGFSVTGGEVYRGSGNPSLDGRYFFCDYLSGNWWSLRPNGLGGYITDSYGAVLSLVSTFGSDYEGELYVARLTTGEIFKLVEPCQAGSKVTGLDALVLSSSSVNVGWDPLPNVQGYQINGRVAGPGGFAKIITTSTNRNISGLIPGTSYEWFVRARCQDLTVTLDSDLKSFSMPVLRAYPALEVLQDGTAWYFDADAAGTWRLFDLMGREVLSQVQTEGRNRIPSEWLGSGLYILSSSQADGSQRTAVLSMPVW